MRPHAISDTCCRAAAILAFVLVTENAAVAEDSINLKMCKSLGAARSYAEAAVFCEMAIDYDRLSDPDLGIALTYIALRDPVSVQDEMPTLNRAIAANPDFAPAYAARAGAYLAKGEMDDAMRDAERASQLDTENADADLVRGEIYSARDDLPAAINALSEAIGHAPDLREARVMRGLAYMKQDDFSAARGDFMQAVKSPLNKSSADDSVLAAKAYLSLGAIDWHEGAEDKALTQINNSISLIDFDAYAYVVRGNLMARRGSTEQALKDLNIAVALDTRNAAAAARSRGYALYNMGKYEKAADSFRTALQRDPTDGYSAIMLYLIGYRSGDEAPSEAEKSAMTIDFTIWPGPILGYLLGKTDEAALEDRIAHAAPAEQPGWECEVAYYVGELALLDNRRDEAKRRLLRAVEVCPNEFDEVPGAKVALSRL